MTLYSIRVPAISTRVYFPVVTASRVFHAVLASESDILYQPRYYGNNISAAHDGSDNDDRDDDLPLEALATLPLSFVSYSKSVKLCDTM